MHAVRLNQPGGNLADELVPDPHPGAGEVLVRVRAAGICHSDGHYRAGRSNVRLPLTLGHEIAGEVLSVGERTSLRPGERVALHYLLACRRCDSCRRSGEQFCEKGEMLGKERDGGYAERIVVPEWNAVPIPAEVGFPAAAVMMCSTATAYHALRLSSLRPGESVAILGFGGLGMSALQLARHMGAGPIIVADLVAEKLARAEAEGARAVNPAERFTERLAGSTGSGVDVVLDFAGHALTTLAALRALAPGGRLIVVAIDLRKLEIDPYSDVLARERRIIGCSDHTRDELVELLELAAHGAIDPGQAITRTVPLDATAIGGALDDLDRRTAHGRTVILT